MSEELPDTVEKGIKSWLAAGAFTLVLVGGDVIKESHGEGIGFWMGGFLVILALPVYLSAAWWKVVKSKMSNQALEYLTTFSEKIPWWASSLAFILLAVVLSQMLPKVQFFTQRAKAPAPNHQALVRNLSVEWGGGAGPVTFHAQYNRTGERLGVYVEWGSLLGAPPVVGTFINWDGRRRAVDFKERFVRSAEMKATIGLVHEVEGNQLVFQFANENDTNLEIGITSGSYLFRIVFVSQDDGAEESYLFAIIASRGATGTRLFSTLIVDPALFLGQGNM
jgi:hypothetical protein